MSQEGTNLSRDQRAAAAVIDHHRQLADELAAHAGRLYTAATADDPSRVEEARDELLTWLHNDLLPHAVAEETTLYPAAGALPAGRLLVDGMMAEHRAITALVAELAAADTPVAGAAAARALSALF